MKTITKNLTLGALFRQIRRGDNIQNSRNGGGGSVLLWGSKVRCKKGIDKGGRII